ncbi:cytochrome P450 [Streptomyces sp. NPDC003006]
MSCSTTVCALLRNPGQPAALRADPSLVEGAVEETLRYDGPVKECTLRYAAEPVELGDATVAAGEKVLIVLSAASHDPLPVRYTPKGR